MSGKQEEQRMDKVNTEIAIIDEQTIRDRIYVVRGVKVMLDFDLAEIYGYTTKAFNQQVKRNESRFPDDFRFQLTAEEIEKLSRSQNVTLNRCDSGRGSNIKYLPWAFSESGIYMLMSVLKGDLATQQSIALIRIFQAMKDYIVEMRGLVSQRDLLRVSMQTAENAEAIRSVQCTMLTQQKEISDQQKAIADQQKRILEHDDILADALVRISNTVAKSELAPYLKQFEVPEYAKEYLIREGRPVRADVTYIDIYSRAKNSVYILSGRCTC